jgi:hypothetical protein
MADSHALLNRPETFRFRSRMTTLQPLAFMLRLPEGLFEDLTEATGQGP